MLPQGSFFPRQQDNDYNLYVVHDALKVTLAADYKPGDNRIIVEGDISRFPRNGIITLADISFHYMTKGDSYFENLELLPGYIDTFKAKNQTIVTQNVVAEHQTAIKNSVINLEKYIGTINDSGTSLIGRINSLKKLIYAPKAWFTASKTTGMTPLTVEFTSQSRANNATYHWNFGDGTNQIGDQSITKTYMSPGLYDVTLTVSNEFGQDSVTFNSMIRVRTEIPAEAKIKIDKPKSIANQLISIKIENDGGIKEDPIINYIWDIADDLPHDNTSTTKALFSEGGLYDLNLKVSTKLGAYRTTTFENAIDITEKTNLWLWTGQKSVMSHEFGLLSETFKIKSNALLHLNTDDSFTEKKQEFYRNNGNAIRNKPSGLGGDCMLFWASGRSKSQPVSFEKIRLSEYNAFADTYTNKTHIDRPWNWLSLSSDKKTYFLMGRPNSISPMLNQIRNTLDLTNLSVTHDDMKPKNYINGAERLGENRGETSYSTAWKGLVGYVLNDKNFYKTDGVLGEPFINLVKLPSPGISGKLVALSSGIYLFGSDTVMAYRPNSGVWETSQSVFNQDIQLVASDKDHRAYLSSDILVKFNEVDLTFTKLQATPPREQWQMTIY